RIPVRDCLRTSFRALLPTHSIDDLINIVENDERHDEVFAVLRPDGSLAGILHIEKVLLAMLNQNVHRIMLVDDLMEPPLGALHENDDLAKAMRNFDSYNLKHLPVLDGNGRLAGFLAREDVFSHYRKILQTSDDL
ncbi:MAG TPA: CBS domain-containing protein, partial [Lentisphaeria bacterium]|nr:CBS domain-containing protein [Lentisphaeria bacterium]